MPTETLTPVPGDPLAVSNVAHVLDAIATNVATTSTKLRSLSSSGTTWTGTAATRAQARSITLPPKLDKASISYSSASMALRSYAQTLIDAQDRSAAAIRAASIAEDDLQSARAAQQSAEAADVQQAKAAALAGVPPSPPTAPRYESAISDAASRLRQATAANDSAHDDQQRAARIAAAGLHEASSEGIRNQPWWRHTLSATAHWASATWVSSLRFVSQVGTTISAIAGLAALALSVVGIAFPPLEAAAAVLETISLVSGAMGAIADTTLAASGKGSWTSVGFDALALAPAGLGKVISEATPMLRESRLIQPSTVVHASTGEVGATGSAAERATASVSHPTWGRQETLARHFQDHGSDFGATSIHEYAEQAHALLQEGLNGLHPIKLDPFDGVIRVYDPVTERFGAYNRDFTTRTFYRPDPAEHGQVDNWAYWLAQDGEVPKSAR